MLSREEARERMAEHHNQDWAAQALERVSRFRGEKRRAAEILLEQLQRSENWAASGYRPPTKEEQEAAMARQAEAVAFFDGASPKVLRSVFEACQPSLAEDLIRWWDWARSNTRLRNGQLFTERPELTRYERYASLEGLLSMLGSYHVDALWIAEWAGHDHWSSTQNVADFLLACVDDPSNGEGIYETLIQSIKGEHPTAVMGNHVLSVLTRASRPDGWELVEGMLIGAQRQEGLRASILEHVPNAHPEAFKRLLQLLVEHKMLRFGGVLTAVGQWVGVHTSAEDEAAAEQWLNTLIDVSTLAPSEILQTDSAVTFALALRWLGRRDCSAAFEVACEVAGQSSRSREFRILATQWLGESRIPEAGSVIELLATDQDPWLAARALETLRFFGDPSPAVFQATEDLLNRWPDEPITLSYSALHPATTTYDRLNAIRSLLRHREDLPFARLEPWLDEIVKLAGSDLIHHLRGREQLEPGERQLLLDLAGKGRQRVRLGALELLAKAPLRTGDAEQLEPVLRGKAEAIRRSVIRLLTQQDAGDAVASARRLWSGSEGLKANQLTKDAAAEILSLLAETGGAAETSEAAETGAVAELATELLGQDPSEEQQVFLKAAAGTPDDEDALDPAFGLFTEADRTPAVQPTMPDGRVELVSNTAGELLLALDALVTEHRDLEVTIRDRRGNTTERLLGELRTYPSPFDRPTGRNRGEVVDRPLKSEIEDCWAAHQSRHPDSDGLEVFRALILLENSYYSESSGGFLQPMAHSIAATGELDPVRLEHRRIVDSMLDWLLAPTLSEIEPDQLLKLMLAECSFVTPNNLATTVPPESLEENPRWRLRDIRLAVPTSSWMYKLLGYHQYLGSELDDQQFARLFGMLRWLQQPLPDSECRPIVPEILYSAHHRRIATDADLLDDLLGLSANRSYDGRYQPSPMLTRLTAHERQDLLKRLPKAVQVADRLRDRVVGIELRRGELPTGASQYVQALGCIEGAELVLDLLSALGSADLIRGWTSNESKSGQISALVRKSFPLAGDEGPDFKRLAKQKGVGSQRLVELAIYAPQWSALVEEALGWKGLADAVWWLHAHTKDRGWTVGREVLESWQSTIAQMTTLTPEDLVDGAVDVDWFQRLHPVLGPKRWTVVYDAAKLSSSGVGHNRAKLFADAMLGKLDHAKLTERIERKRHQDSVRALGLLPLPKAKRRRADELFERYSLIRTFEQGAVKFGNQRKTSERLAARVGLDNLARTAGYADPQRFSWAMEEAGVADLKKGPVVVAVGDVTLRMSIDEEGVATTSVERSGRALKNVPVKLRKNSDVVALKARQTELAGQVKRIRTSLEAAMNRSDQYSESELLSLTEHPIVGPMLRSLVVADRRGSLGLPAATGFVGPTGRLRKLQEPLRVAHTVDLFNSGEWPKWQALFFDQERRQPFKQVFRELYLPTEGELSGASSNRYEGHQVQASQARALLGARSWYHNPDSGTFSTTNHAAGVVSHLDLSIESFGSHGGELPVVGDVTFRRRGGDPLTFDDVPAHVFSETMRDVDLVVSVAHAGGVDPETSQSTVEMRVTLARETVRVLRLANVEFTTTHALISGQISEYSLHLGSGVAQRRSGAALLIRAAPSQRRGRIFLPFADDDPKTAEILSILLLLARDDEIQDPAILRQIRQ